MIAIGIGLHNLGEGLAIGSAYAVGELAIAASLVIGFAIHNTTEGLAVVVPLAGRPVSLLRLLGLGLLAGAPAVAGTLIGSTVVNAELSAFLLGIGVGAILQVIVQIVPSLRDRASSLIDPVTYGGLAAGALVMYATGLLVVV
ncbi:MAG: ZIP family metal transporter, partial [Pseudonocardiaceae bacterium]